MRSVSAAAHNVQEHSLSPPAVRDSQGTADGHVHVVVDVHGEDAPGCVGAAVQLPYLCYRSG